MSPAVQLAFVENLPTPLRYALVCLLYDGEINNGGMDLVFSCTGLLLPQIIAGLSYYGFVRQSERLRDIVAGLGLSEFPRSHNDLMDAFYDRYPEDGADSLRAAEADYYSLDAGEDLRAGVDERIRSEPDLYFRLSERPIR